MKNLNLFVLLSFLAFIGMGCNDNEPNEPGTTPGTGGETPTSGSSNVVTIKSILDQLSADQTITFTEDQMIEGTVISDDEPGNFFKTIVVQDNTGGITIPVNKTNLYEAFPKGSKFQLSINGLSAGLYNNLPQIASLGEKGLSRIDETVFDAIATNEGEGTAITPKVVTISEFNANPAMYLNTLVKLDGVQFADDAAGKTYADAENKKSTNATIVDCEGNEVILRTSGYASFAGDTTPDTNGSITAVASIYKDVAQLFIRDLSDVALSAERCGGSNGGSNGGDVAAQSCINEDFEAYSKDNVDFAGFINQAVAGPVWTTKVYDNNAYIQQSAYQNGSVDSWFLLNVDFDKADVFSFSTKDGYDKGAVLTVLYSTDYKSGDTLDASKWTDITNNFAIAAGSEKYAESFTESGEFDLSSIAGQGFIAFRYVGNESNGLTTTMQVDNIKVTDKEDGSCN